MPPPPAQPQATPQPPTQFPLFPLLPPELRALILHHAATPPPQIHFFVLPPSRTTPTPTPTAITTSTPRTTDSPWSWPLEVLEPDDLPLNLVPHHQSGARGRVHLAQSCHAAHAAVQRHDRGVENRTVLRTPQVWRRGGPGRAGGAGLVLDLTRDLVCFGGPDAGCAEVGALVAWGEGNHVLFAGARRFAVRYGMGWERPGGGPFQHDERCRAGWWGQRGRVGEVGFCSRCVARLVEKFEWLEELYLVVDEPDGEVGQGTGERTGEDGVWIRMVDEKVFEAYSRTYFSPDVSMFGARLREASEVLGRIRSNMVCDMVFWATNSVNGLLTLFPHSWTPESFRCLGHQSSDLGS
ncbi:hypothetical protein BT67DRAFT_214106 [Trichocladium antarcticum]|uniref:2EXR domain-containing protein n=1 Tax=Trichocladium antarcticum TaxID=1450529 RepID=A0AAN6ZAG4_9PEZI|nr:hypothetical protein BT67DRAFT_214106 [Trichocladium antarcticum]